MHSTHFWNGRNSEEEKGLTQLPDLSACAVSKEVTWSHKPWSFKWRVLRPGWHVLAGNSLPGGLLVGALPTPGGLDCVFFFQVPELSQEVLARPTQSVASPYCHILVMEVRSPGWPLQLPYPRPGTIGQCWGASAHVHAGENWMVGWPEIQDSVPEQGESWAPLGSCRPDPVCLSAWSGEPQPGGLDFAVCFLPQ